MDMRMSRMETNEENYHAALQDLAIYCADNNIDYKTSTSKVSATGWLCLWHNDDWVVIGEKPVQELVCYDA